jgi:hypothetical protein
MMDRFIRLLYGCWLLVVGCWLLEKIKMNADNEINQSTSNKIWRCALLVERRVSVSVSFKIKKLVPGT